VRLRSSVGPTTSAGSFHRPGLHRAEEVGEEDDHEHVEQLQVEAADQVGEEGERQRLVGDDRDGQVAGVSALTPAAGWW
jgi:hypothetical protein